MKVRELRAADAADLLGFLQRDFPEEEALLGTRPEGFQEVVRRVFRWDVRLVLGLLRLVGRPIFRFFVIEEGGRLAATTLLTYSPRAGYVSMVVVAPEHRRRGFARTLLEEARRAARARGRRYVVLDVLAANTPARTLYERLGYRTLRSTAYFVHDRPSALPPAPGGGVTGQRPFRPRDARELARIDARSRPADVVRVLPTSPRDFTGSAWESGLLASERAAWVIDDGEGPRAWVSATISKATEAGHLSNPIVDGSVTPERVEALVRTAAAWCATRGAPRLLAMVPEENERGRAALTATGFRDVLPVLTLYRTVD